VRGVQPLKHLNVYRQKNEIGNAGEMFAGRLTNLHSGGHVNEAVALILL